MTTIKIPVNILITDINSINAPTIRKTWYHSLEQKSMDLVYISQQLSSTYLVFPHLLPN